MAVAGAITFEITGLPELDAKFAQLGKTVQKKILRQALRPATKLVHAAAKQIVPQASGTSNASLKVRAGKRSRRTPNRVSIVVITEAGFYKGKSFYFAFNEFGHRQGSRKLGNARKQIAPKRWLKRALKSVEVQAREMAKRSIAEGIQREWASANGSAGSTE